MQKGLCSGGTVAREERLGELRRYINEEYHLNRGVFVGNFEHFASFLNIIGKKHRKIDESAFELVVETFFNRYRPDTISFDNLGRVDLDIEHPLKSSLNLNDPTYEKCIIASQVYYAWVIVVVNKPSKIVEFYSSWPKNDQERAHIELLAQKRILSAYRGKISENCRWILKIYQWTSSQLHPDVDQSGIFALHTVDCLLRHANPNEERPVTPELLRYEFATAVADIWVEHKLHRLTKAYYHRHEKLIRQGWDDRKRSLELADQILSTKSSISQDRRYLPVLLDELISEREVSNRRMGFSEKDGGLHEIQEIVDSSHGRGRFEYLVHWKGYSDTESSWESLDNVAGAWESVAEFEKRWPEKEKPGRNEIESEKGKQAWKEIKKIEINKAESKQNQEIRGVQARIEGMLGEANTEESSRRFMAGPKTVWPWRDPALMSGGKI